MNTIETKRLILRQWSVDDATDMFEYAKSEQVGPNAGWKPHKSEEESVDIIKMFIKDDDVWAIELKENGKVIGSIGIHDRKPDDTIQDRTQKEIGYVLSPDYWGNGYMTEAVEGAKKYCFEELGIDIVWCGHHDFNVRSQRVIERCGFKYKFSKQMTLNRLDDKVVTTLFYWIENTTRNN